MNVKGGTQTWSNAQQRTDFKSDGAHTMSAVDKQKNFGDESLGDTLNKVADPNFVDNAKKMRTTGKADLGKDAFMTLLLTQMKNQDPTSPLKSHEMAAQLAQFTSLEKLTNINDGIENLRKDNQPEHNFQALQFIGKTVTMDNSKIAHGEANESHNLRFTLPQDEQKGTVEVRDATGNAVRKMEIKNLKAGVTDLSWNGKTEEGATAPVGDYTMVVEAFGSNGKKLFVQTKADGIVTGVNFTAKGAQLLMGKQAINLSDVKTISDPNVGSQNPQTLAPPQAAGMPQGMPPEMQAAIQKAMDQQVAGQNSPPTAAPTAAGHMMPIEPQAQGPKKVEVKPETKANAAKRASLSKGDLNDSSMSQGLINTLNKEGAKAGMSGT